MSKLIINGGSKLKGEIKVEGAKNAVLPILAATVMNSGINIIKGCPDLSDVALMFDILKALGCKIIVEGDTVLVDSSTLNNTEISDNLAKEMRSSIFLMGPMLARARKVTISYPGVCVTLLAQNKMQVYPLLKSETIMFGVK